MNTSSHRNDIPDVQEVAQSALHAWNEDSPLLMITRALTGF